MSDLEIMRLKKFLCQLNWALPMAFFNFWYLRYFSLDLYYFQIGQNIVVFDIRLITGSAIARFVMPTAISNLVSQTNTVSRCMHLHL